MNVRWICETMPARMRKPSENCSPERILRLSRLRYKGGDCMEKSVHSREYAHVLASLVRMRKRAGLTQRELADRLDREQSFVWRIEVGERRIDLVEFHWVCNALGADAGEEYKQLVRRFHKAYSMDHDASPLLKAAEPEPVYGKPTSASAGKACK